MRRLLIAALLSTAVLSAPAPAGAATHKVPPSCAKKGSKTVAGSRDARVFTTGGSQFGRLYGCWRATGHPIRLATRDDDIETSSDFSDVRLAGRYVAWYGEASDLSCEKYAMCPPGSSDSSAAVHVFDLKRRRAVRTTAAAVTGQGLVLTQHGAVAWLTGSGATAEVRAADASGTRTLDTGAIAPASLRAEISIVSWVREGVERFARLR